jgi:hypothetical protein
MTQLLEMVGGLAKELKSMKEHQKSMDAGQKDMKVMMAKFGMPMPNAKAQSRSSSMKQEDEDEDQQQHTSSSPMPVSPDAEAGAGDDVNMDDAEPMGSGESPELHSTGAHNLFEWPTINKFFTAVGINEKDYPNELEQQQGVLRLYSTGSSGDKLPTSMGPPSSSVLITESYPSPGDDVQYGSNYEKLERVPNHHIGGLNRDKSIRLDKDTVMKLHDSYISNMWIIFPIIPLERLRQRFARFIQQYSPSDDEDVKPYYNPHHHTPPAYDSPQDVVTTTTSSTSSAKRNWSVAFDPANDSSRRGYAPPPLRKVDHSVNNAIVLLILAIGKLCEHDKFLKSDPNAPLPGSANEGGRDYPYKASPGAMDTASTPSPGYNMNRSGVGSRGSSLERSSGTTEKKPENANVDIYPGLAYYTEASQILGSLTGGRDCYYAHAYLLAALYMGQIGRVYSAYDWVSRAANIVVELRRKHADRLLGTPDYDPIDAATTQEQRDYIEMLTITFWTVHQMEGDIRAELDNLPQSGLASLVSGSNGTDVRFPRNLPSIVDSSRPVSLFRKDIDVSGVVFHFTSQLFIRKVLNKIHDSLYGADQDPNKQRYTIIDLWNMIQAWRPRVPRHAWRDADTPAMDILNARLRAKYYGAAYIVSRPWLQTVLHPEGIWVETPLVIEDYDAVREKKFEADLDGGNVGWDIRDNFARAVGCRRCILGALHSTVAFDGLLMAGEDGRISVRPKLTNIQGTAAA